MAKLSTEALNCLLVILAYWNETCVCVYRRIQIEKNLYFKGIARNMGSTCTKDVDQQTACFLSKNRQRLKEKGMIRRLNWMTGLMQTCVYFDHSFLLKRWSFTTRFNWHAHAHPDSIITQTKVRKAVNHLTQTNCFLILLSFLSLSFALSLRHFSLSRHHGECARCEQSRCTNSQAYLLSVRSIWTSRRKIN